MVNYYENKQCDSEIKDDYAAKIYGKVIIKCLMKEGVFRKFVHNYNEQHNTIFNYKQFADTFHIIILKEFSRRRTIQTTRYWNLEEYIRECGFVSDFISFVWCDSKEQEEFWYMINKITRKILQSVVFINIENGGKDFLCTFK